MATESYLLRGSTAIKTLMSPRTFLARACPFLNIQSLSHGINVLSVNTNSACSQPASVVANMVREHIVCPTIRDFFFYFNVVSGPERLRRRADEGEERWIWSNTVMQRRGEWEITEQTRRPTASSGTIPLCEHLGNRTRSPLVGGNRSTWIVGNSPLISKQLIFILVLTPVEKKFTQAVLCVSETWAIGKVTQPTSDTYKQNLTLGNHKNRRSLGFEISFKGKRQTAIVKLVAVMEFSLNRSGRKFAWPSERSLRSSSETGRRTMGPYIREETGRASVAAWQLAANAMFLRAGGGLVRIEPADRDACRLLLLYRGVPPPPPSGTPLRGRVRCSASMTTLQASDVRHPELGSKKYPPFQYLVNKLETKRVVALDVHEDGRLKLSEVMVLEAKSDCWPSSISPFASYIRTALRDEKPGERCARSQRHIMDTTFFNSPVDIAVYMEIRYDFEYQLDNEGLNTGYFKQDGVTHHTSSISIAEMNPYMNPPTQLQNKIRTPGLRQLISNNHLARPLAKTPSTSQRLGTWLPKRRTDIGHCKAGPDVFPHPISSQGISQHGRGRPPPSDQLATVFDIKNKKPCMDYTWVDASNRVTAWSTSEEPAAGKTSSTETNQSVSPIAWYRRFTIKIIRGDYYSNEPPSVAPAGTGRKEEREILGVIFPCGRGHTSVLNRGGEGALPQVGSTCVPETLAAVIGGSVTGGKDVGTRPVSSWQPLRRAALRTPFTAITSVSSDRMNDRNQEDRQRTTRSIASGYHYTPEIKLWPTFKSVLSAGKDMAAEFWDARSLLNLEFLQRGETITAIFHSEGSSNFPETLLRFFFRNITLHFGRHLSLRSGESLTGKPHAMSAMRVEAMEQVVSEQDSPLELTTKKRRVICVGGDGTRENPSDVSGVYNVQKFELGTTDLIAQDTVC
ncbi:hypothetical protein PR048_009545 [Dryococelus australis]|uniref:Uncharacterized protein n=1 Tax=Dryococelus australis TaxID=614101 RepID=A0ABQ9I090_9NEOP|nr:hypothetical protein PR048_009545 [Dryococelus australis]